MTTTPSTSTDRFAEAAVVEAARGRGEPDWLVERRAEAARAFETLPMPSTLLRPWKYTDVSDLDLAAFPPVEPSVTIEASAPEGGSAVGTLLDAIAFDSDALNAELGGLIPATEGKFQALNAIEWRGGIAVHAAARGRFEAPVVVDLRVDESAPASISPRVVINAEEQSEVTVVLRLESGAAPLLVAGVIEVYAAQAATVRLLIDERWGAATQDFTFIRTRLGRDADVQVASLAIGGHLVKQTIEALVEGEGANSVIRGVALGDADQHFDFVTLQDHIGPRTTSEVEIKAALAGASRSIYYGVTRVEETAAGASADQANRNLLLSGHAKADSDPVLEILTANVIRCGHAAAVGPVDNEALFYLQSRGLDYRTSLQLLVTGFFQSAIGGIPLDGVSEQLAEVVQAKLATAAL
ncbi:MAG: SufD family Fe-S cluster assembly protein [Dehalococcoidia bacterium]